MAHKHKASCVVCGLLKVVAYRGDTGPVCEDCARADGV